MYPRVEVERRPRNKERRAREKSVSVCGSGDHPGYVPRNRENPLFLMRQLKVRNICPSAFPDKGPSGTRRVKETCNIKQSSGRGLCTLKAKQANWGKRKELTAWSLFT